MRAATDYRITKLEKGPLQRFKNQNLILKKFGETGLKIYRAITGKRTVNELHQDLDIDKELFDSVISYLQEAAMVELTPVIPKEKPPKAAVEEVPTPPEEEEVEEKAPEEAEEVAEEEVKPVEEEEEKAAEEGIEIEEEIKPLEIEPIEEEAAEEKAPEEEEAEEVPEEEAPEEEAEEEEALEEELELEGVEEEAPEEEELTPIEKIIKDKYGDIGLQVYNLIDGQKTAEEIMTETGLSESKLIEILDFMDDQGIIKLDYPKAKEKEVEEPTEEEKKEATEAFGPILGEDVMPEEITIPSPVEIPMKAPMDIVKSVQMKAKLMLKYKHGGKIYEELDGKKDVIDIALKLNIPLYTLYDILHFMLDNGMVIMKPVTRMSVKKKYGDDGYTVYKKYGREGLMLYELIGRDLTIKQMAEKVSTDYPKVVDMFLFIHEVLGIELPIDRNVLERQLGL